MLVKVMGVIVTRDRDQGPGAEVGFSIVVSPLEPRSRKGEVDSLIAMGSPSFIITRGSRAGAREASSLPFIHDPCSATEYLVAVVSEFKKASAMVGACSMAVVWVVTARIG